MCEKFQVCTCPQLEITDFSRKVRYFSDLPSSNKSRFYVILLKTFCSLRHTLLLHLEKISSSYLLQVNICDFLKKSVYVQFFLLKTIRKSRGCEQFQWKLPNYLLHVCYKSVKSFRLNYGLLAKSAHFCRPVILRLSSSNKYRFYVI